MFKNGKCQFKSLMKSLLSLLNSLIVALAKAGQYLRFLTVALKESVGGLME